MTNDIAVRVHKDSVVQDSIYGKRVRGLDVFLTVIIYTLSLIHISGAGGQGKAVGDGPCSALLQGFD